MDGKLVTGLPSADDYGGGGTSRPSPISRYEEKLGEKFEELCGYYMSLGMSYHDYWDGAADMVKYYRKADELRREQKNTELWLQAVYIYEALIDASPVFNPLSKKGKPFPFRSEPVPITATGSREHDERKKKQMLENGKEAMKRMVDAFNKRFEQKLKKGGEVDNGD